MKTAKLERTLAAAMVVAAMVILFGAVGERDYQDAVLDQQAYCAGVSDKSWPDYRGNAGEVCR